MGKRDRLRSVVDVDKTEAGGYNDNRRDCCDKRSVPELSHEMTAIRGWGRSFPFAVSFSHMEKQCCNAEEYQGVSKKLTICNHKRPPFRGKGFPL